MYVHTYIKAALLHPPPCCPVLPPGRYKLSSRAAVLLCNSSSLSLLVLPWNEQLDCQLQWSVVYFISMHVCSKLCDCLTLEVSHKVHTYICIQPLFNDDIRTYVHRDMVNPIYVTCTMQFKLMCKSHSVYYININWIPSMCAMPLPVQGWMCVCMMWMYDP